MKSLNASGVWLLVGFLSLTSVSAVLADVYHYTQITNSYCNVTMK